MAINAKALSFDNLLSDIKVEKLTDLIDRSTYFDQSVAVASLVKNKQFAATQEFYRNVLHSDNIIGLHETYQVFFKDVNKIIDMIANRYVKSVTEFGDKYRKNAESKVKFKKEELNALTTSAASFEVELDNAYEFTIDNEVPKIDEVFTELLKLFGKGTFYIYDQEDLQALYDVLNRHSVKFINTARGAIIGSDYAISYKSFANELFKVYRNNNSDPLQITVEPEDIGQYIDIVNNYNKDIDNINKSLNEVKGQYKRVKDAISKAKTNMNLNVGTVDKVDQCERFFITLLSEITLSHYLAFSAKLTALNDRFNQAAKIINIAMLQNNEVVKESYDFRKETINNILTSDAKYDNTAFTKFDDHLIELEFNENILNAMIKESIILAKNIDVEYQIGIVHEGIVDSITETVKKIRAYIENIYNKFIAWMDKFTLNTQKYLSKYKDLITKNPLGGFDHINGAYKYSKGIDNIRTGLTVNIDVAGMMTLDNEEKIKEFINNVRKGLVKIYDASRHEDDFNELTKTYFMGADDIDDTITITPADLDHDKEKIFDFLYNNKQYIEVINSNKAALFKVLDSVYKGLSNVKEEPQTKEASSAPVAVKATESMALLYNNGFFNEKEEIVTTGGDSANSTNISTDAGASTKVSKGDQEIKGLPDDDKKALAKSSDKLKNAKSAYQKLCTTLSQYFNGQIQAVETMASFLMKIIKLHVQYCIAQANK